VRRLALGLVFLAGPVAAADPPEPLPAAQLAAIEAAIGSFMTQGGVPGLTTAVVVGRELRWTKGFGVADVENAVPARPGTMYRLASVSKPITAVAVLQLVERGRIDLDAPVRRYVPGFPEKPWPVTSRQLLAHFGGIRHYVTGERLDATRRYVSVLEGLDVFKDDPLVHEPGTSYLYSSYGYNLLGAVVEAASGMRFEDYLRKNVLDPAGIETIRDDGGGVPIPNRAGGYVRTPAGEVRNAPPADTSYKVPGGGLLGTAPDVARFASALENGVLLRRDTLSGMLTRQKTKTGRTVGYGLGWDLRERKGRREAVHSGGQEGVSNILYLQPDHGLAVVILTNLQESHPLPLARRIADILSPRASESVHR